MFETVTPEVELMAITPDAERVIEAAGRTCYLSFGKTGFGTVAKFVRMIVKSGHHSVLEHAYATFRIKGGSRSFTHQVVRHRIAAFSQQSQRYCNEANFRVVEPASVAQNPEAHQIFVDAVENARQAYGQLQELGIRNEDARFLLPNAVEAEIVISANLREWRHICYVQYAPTIFEDFVIDEEREIATTKIPS